MMNWLSISDVLALLMTVYVGVGVGLCTVMIMFYISRDSFDQHKFAFCVELILSYGFIGLCLIALDLVKLGRFVETRDYKGWWERQKEDFQAWNKVRKKTKKNLKEFKAKQKAKRKK